MDLNVKDCMLINSPAINGRIMENVIIINFVNTAMKRFAQIITKLGAADFQGIANSCILIRDRYFKNRNSMYSSILVSFQKISNSYLKLWKIINLIIEEDIEEKESFIRSNNVKGIKMVLVKMIAMIVITRMVKMTNTVSSINNKVFVYS